MCGLEGHGAFQSFPGGKLKGELKCTKHRNFLSQLGMIRLQHGIDEDGLRALFKLPGYNAEKAPSAKKASAAATPAAAPATVPAAAAETAKDSAAATTGTAPAAAAIVVSTNAVDGKGKEAPVSGAKAEAQASAVAPAAVPAKGTGKQSAPVAAAPAVPAAAPAAAVTSAPAPVVQHGAVEGTNWQLNLDGPGLSAGFLGTGALLFCALCLPVVAACTVKDLRNCLSYWLPWSLFRMCRFF
jgi:hypothetical protein